MERLPLSPRRASEAVKHYLSFSNSHKGMQNMVKYAVYARFDARSQRCQKENRVMALCCVGVVVTAPIAVRFEGCATDRWALWGLERKS